MMNWCRFPTSSSYGSARVSSLSASLCGDRRVGRVEVSVVGLLDLERSAKVQLAWQARARHARIRAVGEDQPAPPCGPWKAGYISPDPYLVRTRTHKALPSPQREDSNGPATRSLRPPSVRPVHIPLRDCRGDRVTSGTIYRKVHVEAVEQMYFKSAEN